METEVPVLQLVALIKRQDVYRVGDEPDPECAQACGPIRGCPATRSLPAAAGPAPLSLPASAGPTSSLPASAGPDDDMSDAGMSTVEYAVGTVAAAAFAAVLYQIVTGGSVLAGLTDLINRAMSVF